MAKKVLICDDDEGILEVMKIILEEDGIEVKLLSNGKAFIKKVKEFSPDLIFLDLWMPGIEGSEIIKLIKQDKTTNHIPVVIVSALSKKEIEKVVTDTKADDYLSKPFDMNNLLAKVQTLTHH